MIFKFSIADKDRTEMFEFVEKNGLILNSNREWTHYNETRLCFVYTVDADPEVFLMLKLAVPVSVA